MAGTTAYGGRSQARTDEDQTTGCGRCAAVRTEGGEE